MSAKPTTPANRQKTGFRGPSPDVGKATQFRPGQSGNLSGRPRIKLLSEAYRLVLADLEERGDRSVAETIAKAMARKAMKGSIPAARELADRTEGRAVQAVKLEAAMDEATARVLVDLAKQLLPIESEDTE